MPAAIEIDRLELSVYPPDGPGGESPLVTWTGKKQLRSLDWNAGVGATVDQATAELVGGLAFQGGGGGAAGLPRTVPVTVGTGSGDTDIFNPGNVVTVDVALDASDPLSRAARLRMDDTAFRLRADGRTVEATVQLENWLWATLRDRNVSARIRGEPLSDAIQRVLDLEAPEVSLDYGLSNDPSVTATFDAESLGRAIIALVGDRGQAKAEGDILSIRPLPNSTAGQFTLDDLRLPNRRLTADGLTTRARVDGGTLGVPIPEALRPTVVGFENLAGETRLAVQLPIAVAELDRVALQTRHSGADGQLIVRLHPNDDGDPLAPGDTQRDIASRGLVAEFVSPGGRTAFEFPEHSIGARDPFLLIEQRTDPGGGTQQGFEVGITPDGGPAVLGAKARRSIVVETRDNDAELAFGRRDARIRDRSLSSFKESRSRGDRVLSLNNSPSEELSSPALSSAAHSANLLEAYDISIPPIGVGEPFVVTDIQTQIESGQLTRTLTFRQPPGFSPP